MTAKEKRLRRFRQPRIVALELKKISLCTGKQTVFYRWYVTLKFGSARKRLAVSAKVADWMIRRAK